MNGIIEGILGGMGVVNYLTTKYTKGETQRVQSLNGVNLCALYVSVLLFVCFVVNFFFKLLYPHRFIPDGFKLRSGFPARPSAFVSQFGT